MIDRAVIEEKFCTFRVDMQAMIDRTRTSLDGEVKRANDLDSESVRVPVSD